MEQEPKPQISLERFMELETATVRNFDQLIELISRFGEFSDIKSETSEYAADEVISSIEKILRKSERGEEVTENDLTTVTGKFGIRDAVMRLLNQQELEKAA